MTSHPWMPVSPCGPDCLPGSERDRRAGRGRILVRYLTAVVTMASAIILVAALPVLGQARREKAVRAWFRAMLGAFGVRLEVYGPQRFAPVGVVAAKDRDAGVLVVSNHISWLDIVALNAVQPLRMVAKRQIAQWPVVGTLAARAGTVFIDRERLSVLPEAVGALTTALRSGGVVGVFPEGTTWCGRGFGDYRPAAFQAAVDAGAMVRPVTLRFRWADGEPTTVAAFVGDETLLSSLRRVVSARDLTIEVHVLPAISPARARGRRSLALAARAASAVLLTGTEAMAHAA